MDVVINAIIIDGEPVRIAKTLPTKIKPRDLAGLIVLKPHYRFTRHNGDQHEIDWDDGVPTVTLGFERNGEIWTDHTRFRLPLDLYDRFTPDDAPWGDALNHSRMLTDVEVVLLLDTEMEVIPWWE